MAQKSAYFLTLSAARLQVLLYGLTLLSLSTSVALAQNSKFEKARQWSAKTGNFTTNATLVSGNRQTITLQKSPGEPEVTVPVGRLCDADREFVGEYCEYVLKTLRKDVKHALYAGDALKLYEDFQANGFVDSSNQIYVESKIEALRKLAAENTIILGDRFLPASELPALKIETQELVDQWLALRSGDDLTKIYKANKNDPTSLEASILLSLWFEVHQADHKAAQRQLDNAVDRGIRYLPIATPADNTNLRAAINNLAVSYARDNKTSKAVKVWADIPSSLSASLQPAFEHNLSKTIQMANSDRSGLSKANHAMNRKLEGLPVKSVGSVSGGWQLLCPVNQQEEVRNNLQFLLADQNAQRIHHDWIEDTRCVKCTGTAVLRCPFKSCVKGAIEKRIMQPQVANLPGGGTRIVGYKLHHIEYLKCQTCGGDGLVTCPFCDGGVQE